MSYWQDYEVAEIDGNLQMDEAASRRTVDGVVLKTCPFCGHEPHKTIRHDKKLGKRVRISCPNQLCPIYHVWFGTVLIWNRRSS